MKPSVPVIAVILIAIGIYSANADAQTAQAKGPTPTGVQPVLLLPAALAPDLTASVTQVRPVPQAKNIVNLVEGTPFTVPAGNHLVITDWASPATSGTIFLDVRLNDVQVWEIAATGSDHQHRVGSMRTGIRANPGDIVTIKATTTIEMYAFGYLEPI